MLLEVSSPGVSDVLTGDRDFAVFKGFPVEVQLSEVLQKKSSCGKGLSSAAMRPKYPST